MKIDLPIKSSNTFLLGWFVFASVFIHLFFIALTDNDTEREVMAIKFSTPLQITVISSRPVTTPSPQATQQKTESVRKTLPQPLIVKAVKNSPLTNKPPVRITKASALSEKKPEIVPDDNKETKRITEPPTTTVITEVITAKDAPLNHLRQQLKKAIEANFTYPRIARRMGWEGLVEISLRIENDGSLKQVNIARSSGHKVLDENAKKNILAIGRIQLASNVSFKASNTEIEVLYRLTD